MASSSPEPDDTAHDGYITRSDELADAIEEDADVPMSTPAPDADEPQPESELAESPAYLDGSLDAVGERLVSDTDQYSPETPPVVIPTTIRTVEESHGEEPLSAVNDLQDTSMTSEPSPHDVFVKPEEDLVSAQDALLSELPQTVNPIVTHMEPPAMHPDDLAMQVDSRNLKSEADPPIIHHTEGDAMAVDDMRTLSLQEEIALAESFALDERDESLAPEPFPAVEPGPPNGEADPDALHFESTGKYECRLILSGHTLSISALKFSPDGTMLASSAADKTVKLWDAASGHILRTFEGHTSGISDVAWSSDSEFVASASDDKTVRIWSLDLGITVKVLKGHTNYVFCLNYNPAGSLLASGGFDESVRIWDVARGKTVKVLPAHSDPVTAVSFNHDGSLIVSCSMDGLIRIWDTDSGQCLKTLVDDDNPVCSHVRFSANSQFVLVGTQDSTVRLWNCHKSRCVKTYVGHTNKTYCLVACFGKAFGPGGVGERQVVVSGSEDNKVYIWDLQTREIVQVLEGHRDAVLAVAMHPTKKVIASASKERDLSIRLWYS